MKTILEYINYKKVVKDYIKATNETIHEIVRKEVDRLGPEADLNHIDVSGIESMIGLFDCDSGNHLFSSVFDNINMTIGKTFHGYDNFKNFNCDISKWNVSNVKDMCCMFHCCHKFNCDISNWDVSKVIDFTHMFDGCTNFDKDLSSWKINYNAKKDDMFLRCPLPFDKWPKI